MDHGASWEEARAKTCRAHGAAVNAENDPNLAVPERIATIAAAATLSQEGHALLGALVNPACFARREDDWTVGPADTAWDTAGIAPAPGAVLPGSNAYRVEDGLPADRSTPCPTVTVEPTYVVNFTPPPTPTEEYAEPTATPDPVAPMETVVAVTTF